MLISNIHESTEENISIEDKCNMAKKAIWKRALKKGRRAMDKQTNNWCHGRNKDPE